MPVEPERRLFTDTELPTRGFRYELLRGLSDAVLGRLKIAGIVVLLAAVAMLVYGHRQYQHRRQVRAEFAAEHARDCAESWNGVENALHPYEEAHKHLLDELAAEDTEAIVNRDVPDYLTRAAALHDSVIHARAICPAQADPSRETNNDRVGAIDGVDVRDLF
jgi:hypothetical protein